MGISIELPSFKFSEFVDHETKEFLKYYLRQAEDFQLGDRIAHIENRLGDFYKPEHKIQFLTSLVNPIIIIFSEHEKVCKEPDNCYIKPGFHRIVYFIYGKLDSLGFKTELESFSQEDILLRNKQIDTIVYKLDEIKVGENIIYDDVIEAIESLRKDIQDLKNMYPIGEKKWLHILGGIIGEYSANKALDGVFALALPQLLELLKNNPHLLQ